MTVIASPLAQNVIKSGGLGSFVGRCWCVNLGCGNACLQALCVVVAHGRVCRTTDSTSERVLCAAPTVAYIYMSIYICLWAAPAQCSQTTRNSLLCCVFFFVRLFFFFYKILPHRGRVTIITVVYSFLHVCVLYLCTPWRPVNV